MRSRRDQPWRIDIYHSYIVGSIIPTGTATFARYPRGYPHERFNRRNATDFLVFTVNVVCSFSDYLVPNDVYISTSLIKHFFQQWHFICKNFLIVRNFLSCSNANTNITTLCQGTRASIEFASACDLEYFKVSVHNAVSYACYLL